MGLIMSAVKFLIWGNYDKYPALGPNPDAADPTTGLTPRQARAVLVTWDMVRPNIRKHGPAFFVKFFKEYPETQKKFHGFAGQDPDSLLNDSRLIAHGVTVFTAVSNIVDNLGDTAVLAEILKTTGKNHKARGVEKKSFVWVRLVLLEYLKENLGEEWTPAAQEGWEIALTAVNTVVFSAYD